MSNSVTENVKIIINEEDKTTPYSRPDDSTDIVFIPGFLGTDPEKVMPDTPVLFNSVKEFEKFVGTAPHIITSGDVIGYDFIGLHEGDKDPSYVMAKHLLSKGMSVLYYAVKLDPTEEISELSGDRFDMSSMEMVGGSFSLTYDNTITTVSGDTLNVYNTDEVFVVTPDSTSIDFYMSYNCNELINSKLLFGFSNSNMSLIRVDVKNPDTSVWETPSVVDIASYKNNKNMLDLKFVFKTKTTSSFELSMSDFVVYDKQDNSSEVLSLADKLYKVVFGTDKTKESIFDTIKDKSVYSVKYITTGGYPAVYTYNNSINSSVAVNMLSCAAARGDAVALIDYQRDDSLLPFGTTSFYSSMNTQFADSSNTEYGTMMYPYAEYTLPDIDVSSIVLPASFGYLNTLATAIKTSPNWLAMAGVARGKVPNIVRLCTPNGILSNMVAEEMQPKYGAAGHNISINCITDVRPYGLTLWGNRTLKALANEKSTVATHFLNIRNMVSDIKKILYTTAKKTTFEQNTASLWLTFKSGVSPLLDQLKSGGAINDYKLIKNETKYNGDQLVRGEISATVRIKPIYAVEYFELTVEITDNDVNVG